MCKVLNDVRAEGIERREEGDGRSHGFPGLEREDGRHSEGELG